MTDVEVEMNLAFERGRASRDAEIATLKGMVNEIQAARHVQREHNDLLVKNHQLREQVTELHGKVGLLLRISKALAATEPNAGLSCRIKSANITRIDEALADTEPKP